MKYFIFDIQILDIQIEFHGKVSTLQKMKIGIFLIIVIQIQVFSIPYFK